MFSRKARFTDNHAREQSNQVRYIKVALRSSDVHTFKQEQWKRCNEYPRVFFAMIRQFITRMLGISQCCNLILRSENLNSKFYP